MTHQFDDIVTWTGRELFDATGKSVGTIAGLAYLRKKYGTEWLLVKVGTGETAKTVLVPAEQIMPADTHLRLPYTKSYVEGAPALAEGERLAKADERLLLLHYGLDSRMYNSTCRLGCGLCMANRRIAAAKKRGL